MAKGFGRKPGKKTVTERECVTVYANENGVECRAETCSECKGTGCDRCKGLGFTKLSQGDIFHA